MNTQTNTTGTATTAATRPSLELSGCSIAVVMTPATTRMRSTTGPMSALGCVRTLTTTCSPSDKSFFEIAMSASCQTRRLSRRYRDLMPIPHGMRKANKVALNKVTRRLAPWLPGDLVQRDLVGLTHSVGNRHEVT